MIRNPDRSFLNTTPRELRRPLFPVPEDIFASDDQVAERHEQEIRSPAIDQAIGDWNDAKEQGDDHGLRAAAKALVDATNAAFRIQGVPIYAHPVLPPQFVKAEISNYSGLTKDRRATAMAHVLDKFDPSAKPGAAQQLAAAMLSDRLNVMDVGSRVFEEAREAPLESSIQSGGSLLASSSSNAKAVGSHLAIERTVGAPESTTQHDTLSTLEYRPNEDPANEQTGEYRPDGDQPLWQPVLRRDSSKNIKFEAFANDALKDPETGRTYPVTYGIIYTDRGTPIPARRNDSGEGRLTTNCHGFVFAEGRYWVEPGFADLILRDDYVKLPTSNMVQTGDIVVYRDKQGRPVHSARVAKVFRDASGKITGVRVIGKRGSLEDKPFESDINEQWPPKGRSRSGITTQLYRHR